MPWAKTGRCYFTNVVFRAEGATRTANILTGKVNPSGKLPVTFPVTEKDMPLQTAEQSPGVKGRVDYKEGIWLAIVGMQPKDQAAVCLVMASYTQFKYSAAEVKPVANGYQVF